MRAGAGALKNGAAFEISLRKLERGVTEIEAGRCTASDFAHAKVSDAGSAQREGLLDIADHDDLGCTIGKRDSGRREGAKDINDDNSPNGTFSAFYQAINSNVQMRHPINPK